MIKTPLLQLATAATVAAVGWKHHVEPKKKVSINVHQPCTHLVKQHTQKLESHYSNRINKHNIAEVFLNPCTFLDDKRMLNFLGGIAKWLGAPVFKPSEITAHVNGHNFDQPIVHADIYAYSNYWQEPDADIFQVPNSRFVEEDPNLN